MANYIDGFVLPIPRKNLDEYTRIAQSVANIWKEHGALSYYEFVGDDLSLEGTRSFNDVTESKSDEVIIFGWVEFESKDARDLAKERVAVDERMSDLVSPLMNPNATIFNPARMAYGGFKKIVSTD